jgi:short-subunit dehydrogenase
VSRPLSLVTGPTSGIGLSFARQLAARGHDLVLVARDRERLDALALTLRDEHGARVEVLPADLADRAQLAPVEERLARTDDPVDLLVNNAGFGLGSAFLRHDVEAEQAMLDVLVTAVLRLTHAAARQMVGRGGGGIVNVASVAAYLPSGPYAAAKRYVVSLSEWTDLAYRGRGVRAMALCPGFTRTELHQRMGARRQGPSWLWLDPDRVVAEGLRDLDRGRRVSVPSKRYKAITTLARVTPVGLQARIQGGSRGG